MDPFESDNTRAELPDLRKWPERELRIENPNRICELRL